MKIDAHFCIAKHIPDLHRMEPRNIGVVVWGSGGFTTSRFLGQTNGAIETPRFVERRLRRAYEQWIALWDHHLSKPSIRNRKGVVIPRESSKFLEALCEKSKQSFRLIDGGMLRERINRSDLEHAAADLFRRLVETPEVTAQSNEQPQLTETFKRILKDTGISRREDYRTRLPVPCEVFGVVRPFVADSAIGPVSKPDAIFQRVLLTREQSVMNNATMLNALVTDKIRPIRRENCTAIIDSSFATTETARNGIRMLENVATVIDVAKPQAARMFSEIAARAA
jgi:hypothetical protein